MTTQVLARPRPRPTPMAWVPRGVVVVGLAAVVLVVPMTLSIGWQLSAMTAVAYAIVGLSLNILAGYTGQISLGHQGFVGVGSMVAANLAHNTGGLAVDPLGFAGSLAAAAGAGAAAALVLGAVALRIKGLYLALVTLVFGSVIADTLLSTDSLDGHEAGVSAVRPMFLTSNERFYLFCLAMLGLVLLVDRALTRSKGGRALIAVRDNELVAQAFGVNVMGYKLFGFALSGAIAGLAGSLLTFTVQSFSNKNYTGTTGFNLALVFIVIVVVGGLGSRVGVVIAGAFFGLLNPLLNLLMESVGLADFYTNHNYAFTSTIGAVLLLQTVILNPGGLGQVVRPIGRWLAGHRFTVHDPQAVSLRAGTADIRA